MKPNVAYNITCSVIISETNQTVVKQNKTIKVTPPNDFRGLTVSPF